MIKVKIFLFGNSKIHNIRNVKPCMKSICNIAQCIGLLGSVMN
jgi:acetylglutamate synthase